jgi:hypothetical protein
LAGHLAATLLALDAGTQERVLRAGRTLISYEESLFDEGQRLRPDDDAPVCPGRGLVDALAIRLRRLDGRIGQNGGTVERSTRNAVWCQIHGRSLWQTPSFGG